MPTFAKNARVRLGGLKRDDLNNTYATVLDWHEERARYSVRLDNGESVRVRPENLFDVQHDPAPSQSAPPTTTTKPAPPLQTDSTLFVVDGRFILPGVPAPRDTTPSTDTGTEHRLLLPAGHWQVQMIETDDRVAIVTLVAVSCQAKPDGEQLDEIEAAWNELSGFTITRSVLLEEGDDAASLTAAVEGSVLTLALPKLKMTAPDLNDIDEEVPVVSDVEPPLEAVYDKENIFEWSFEDLKLAADDLKIAAEDAGATPPPPLRRIRSAAERRKPGSVRRLRSAGAVASVHSTCGGPQLKRSRFAAKAQRRAAATPAREATPVGA